MYLVNRLVPCDCVLGGRTLCQMDCLEVNYCVKSFNINTHAECDCRKQKVGNTKMGHNVHMIPYFSIHQRLTLIVKNVTYGHSAFSQQNILLHNFLSFSLISLL